MSGSDVGQVFIGIAVVVLAITQISHFVWHSKHDRD